MTDGEAREMARELVRGSIVEDAVSQFIAQVLKHAHDERIKPLRKQVADLEAKLTKAVEERDEAIRRRDAWRTKAKGYDAVRRALREKVGAPWPPNLSRALWAGIAADEKKRADDAEAKLAKAVDMMRSLAAMIQHAIGPGKDVFIEPDTGRKLSDAYAVIAEIEGESHD